MLHRDEMDGTDAVRRAFGQCGNEEGAKDFQFGISQ